MRPSALSKTSSTEARLTGFLSVDPLKITSCICSPRSCFADDSPSTQRTASITFDLPQPLGPTTPTSWPGTAMEVGSTKDLKPESLTEVSRKGKAAYVGPSRDARCLYLVESGFYANDSADARREAPRNLPQSGSRARLRDPHAGAGIHLPVPEDRPAGFRHALHRLRARPLVRRAEEPQALHLVVPRPGQVPRGRDQRDPRGAREGRLAAIHAAHGALLRARRDLHDRGGGAPQEGMEGARARRARRDRSAGKHGQGGAPMRGLVAALAACATLACAADDRIAIETFFKVPQYREMSISPDGRTLAGIAPVGKRQNVVVIDLASRKASAVTSFVGTDVLSYSWVNSKRIAFTTGTLATRVADFRGGALMAADIDGGNFRDLQEARDSTAMGGTARRFTRLVRTLPGETDEVVAQEIIPGRIDGGIIVEESRPGDLVRLDTRTGRRSSIGLGKPDSGQGESWVVDSRGVARAFTVSTKGTTRIFYRTGPDEAWKLLDEGRSLSMTWHPLAVGEDDHTLIVSSRKGRDTAAICIYDPQKRDITEILAQHPRVDLESLVRERDGKVVGVRYEADRGGTAWFDDELARVQKAVDTALPGTVNRLAWSTDRQRFLVFARSDVLPGSFYLLDRGTGKMEWLADSAPWIDPKKMAPTRAVRYKARDGLEIPAFLTLPKTGGGKMLPLVMVVHGGPWVPAEAWGYDPEAQFLASRGYAVLQPQFRGTLGYGWKHFSASFKQWGRAMQDD